MANIRGNATFAKTITMFTGIVESLGKVLSIENKGTNRSFWIEGTLSGRLKADESVNHNGVCLTIEEVKKKKYKVSAVKETLDKTNLRQWEKGSIINLERAMKNNGRLDGHIVQGHVDDIVTCVEITEQQGSKDYTFRFDEKFAALVIEKGSVCINGVSLTLFNVTANSFKVTIIPFTNDHTNFSILAKGDIANIEFDILGKYVQRAMELNKKKNIDLNAQN